MKYWCDFSDSDEAPTKDTTSPRKSGVAYLTENLIKRLTKEENVTQITSLHVTLGKELNKKIKVGPDMTCQSAHVRPILTTCSSCKIYDLSATSCVTGWSGEFDMFEWNKVNKYITWLHLIRQVQRRDPIKWCHSYESYNWGYDAASH